MLVYLKALQYSMSESDHLNSINNTGNTFISLDQASTIMADQTQGANPQHFCSRKLEIQKRRGIKLGATCLSKFV